MVITKDQIVINFGPRPGKPSTCIAKQASTLCQTQCRPLQPATTFKPRALAGHASNVTVCNLPTRLRRTTRIGPQRLGPAELQVYR